MEEKMSERKFNFKAEFSALVEYYIIHQYTNILKDKDYVNKPFLLVAT
jgi:hypothetical protein